MAGWGGGANGVGRSWMCLLQAPLDAASLGKTASRGGGVKKALGTGTRLLSSSRIGRVDPKSSLAGRLRARKWSRGDPTSSVLQRSLTEVSNGKEQEPLLRAHPSPKVWIGGDEDMRFKTDEEEEDDERVDVAEAEGAMSDVPVPRLLNWERDVTKIATTDDINTFYKIGPVIGQGTYGLVQECTSLKNGKKYALKRLKKVSLSHYRREMLLSSRVSHPAVLSPLQVLESPEEVFTVSELLEGGELFDVIAEHNMYLGTLSEEAVLELTREMLVALEMCHRSGFAHLDVKPENFCFRVPWSMIKDDLSLIRNNLVLIDFGAAQPFRLKKYAETNEMYDRNMDEYFKGESLLGGTASYVCPEILTNGRFSSRSDLWSLGVTLFMLIAGRRPFDASFEHAQSTFDRKVQENIREEAALPLGESLYSSCEELGLANSDTVELLLNMMNPDPQQRRSATELIDEIDRILHEEL